MNVPVEIIAALVTALLAGIGALLTITIHLLIRMLQQIGGLKEDRASTDAKLEGIETRLTTLERLGDWARRRIRITEVPQTGQEQPV